MEIFLFCKNFGFGGSLGVLDACFIPSIPLEPPFPNSMSAIDLLKRRLKTYPKPRIRNHGPDGNDVRQPVDNRCATIEFADLDRWSVPLGIPCELRRLLAIPANSTAIEQKIAGR